jgi:hypothetical protein
MGIGCELLSEQPARFATIAKESWLGASSIHVSCPLVEPADATYSAHSRTVGRNRCTAAAMTDAMRIALNLRERSDASRS